MSFKTTGTSRVLASSAVASTVAVINSGAGFTVSGPSVTANTPFQTSVITPGVATTSVAVSSLKITGIIVTDSTWNNLDDTAVGSSGGYIKVIGTGFASGSASYLNGVALTTTFQSSTELRVVVPASTIGTYSLMVFNLDGSGAIYLNLALSAAPVFSTTAGSLATLYETIALNSSVAATGDAPLTYSLYSGSLPPGVTLSSSGALSGTTQATATQTTYSFVIQVNDAQNQDSLRSFSITINPDIVSWTSPTNNQSFTYIKNTAITDIPLSATSAAGKTITYSASNLPSGITLTGSTLSGTISTDTAANSTLTATAAGTLRSQNISIAWAISLADPNFASNVLLLQGNNANNLANNTFLDSSANNFTVTKVGDTLQGSVNPFLATNIPGYTPSTHSGSGYFDGTGDYLSASSASSPVANEDFTIECWYCPVSKLTNYPTIWSNYSTYSTSGIALWDRHDSWSTKFVAQCGTQTAISTTVVSNGTWYHLAVTRASGTLRLFINGVLEATQTGANASNTPVRSQISLGDDVSASLTYINGYVSNFRIVKGTAVYTSAFTPPTAPLSAITNTSLLLKFANAGVYDNMCKSNLNTLGDTKISTTQSKYGGSSIYLDGTGDNLKSTIAALGSGNFTIEFWMYRTQTADSYIFFIGDEWGSAGGIQLIQYSSSYCMFIGTASLNYWGAPINNAWTHIALVRNAGTLKMYQNGTAFASSMANTENLTLTTFKIGQGPGAYWPAFGGYIDDLRISKGLARYTANFTPPLALEV